MILHILFMHFGVSDARLVVMGKRGLASSAADVTCSGETI